MFSFHDVAMAQCTLSLDCVSHVGVYHCFSHFSLLSGCDSFCPDIHIKTLR